MASMSSSVSASALFCREAWTLYFVSFFPVP
jgi:hypothetical protein